MTTSRQFKALLAGLATVAVVGTAMAQGTPPVAKEHADAPTGAGQRSTHNTPMGTTGTPAAKRGATMGASGSMGSSSSMGASGSSSASTPMSGGSTGSSTGSSSTMGASETSSSGSKMAGMNSTQGSRAARADRN